MFAEALPKRATAGLTAMRRREQKTRNWLNVVPNSALSSERLTTEGTQRPMSLRNPGTSDRVVRVDISTTARPAA